MQPTEWHAGLLIGQMLAGYGVEQLFTLCGGHISPILVGARAAGLRVIDTRHEATAVFAADAVARLSGVPGVAAVTAGPGLTNTITAVKNAQMAQSPVIILGGATATLLKGRGALQDIDQMALMQPHVKWAVGVKKVRDIAPALARAFQKAQEGVPGPVFIELPVDLLYPEATVRQWTLAFAGQRKNLGNLPIRVYLSQYVKRLFARTPQQPDTARWPVDVAQARTGALDKALAHLGQAERPVFIIGSQAMLTPAKVEALQRAVQALGVPTYLSGMARGLLGRDGLHIRHQRSQALREADLVLLAGVPCDFRLNYGRSIPKSATYIAVNRSADELSKNRKPDLAILADPGAFIQTLAANWSQTPTRWSAWQATLTARDQARDSEIAAQATEPTEYVNPVHLCRELEACIAEDSVIIGDGGDFVATASYIVRPRAPLSWLDPGPFGTLGPGAGFALGAKALRPGAEVWLLYGDGSVGYSLMEFDTFVRHKIPVIAVVGTDAVWAQIAREQTEVLGDDVGTQLGRTNYQAAVEGLGGVGLLVTTAAELKPCLRQAQELARQGQPVLVNVLIGQTDFRKGSISI